MAAGWNVINANHLRQSLRGVTNRDQAIQIIRDWWQAPEQAQHRARGVSVAEDGVANLAFAASFPEYRQHVMERAATSPLSWHGLRAWAHSEAEQGRDTPADVARVLLQDPPKGRRPKGQTPDIFARDNQLAAIVGALQGTPFDSLATTASTDGAFALASTATRQPFNVIRHAWKAHKNVFGANN